MAIDLSHVVQLGEIEKGVKPSTFEELNLEDSGILYFGNRLCPFAHRAWWTILEKDIDIKYYHIDLGTSKPTWFKEHVNPFGTVPCIYDNGNPVYESLIVVEYLNEKYPGSFNIYPDSLLEKAAVRLVVNKFDTGPMYRLLTAKDDESKLKGKEAINQMLDGIEKLFKQQSHGPYFLGNRLSLAEIAIMPFIDRFSTVLKHFRSYDIFEGRESLKNAYEACKQRPAFQSTMQDPEFYIAVYTGYA